MNKNTCCSDLQLQARFYTFLCFGNKDKETLGAGTWMFIRAGALLCHNLGQHLRITQGHPQSHMQSDFYSSGDNSHLNHFKRHKKKKTSQQHFLPLQLKKGDRNLSVGITNTLSRRIQVWKCQNEWLDFSKFTQVWLLSVCIDGEGALETPSNVSWFMAEAIICCQCTNAWWASQCR